MVDRVPAVLVLGGGHVLLSGRALVQVVRFVEVGVAVARRDGIATPPEVTELVATLRAAAGAAVDAARLEVAAVVEERDESEVVGVGEAAAMLGLCVRQVRRRAARDFGGRKRGGDWLLDRALVAAEQVRRARDVR